MEDSDEKYDIHEQKIQKIEHERTTLDMDVYTANNFVYEYIGMNHFGMQCSEVSFPTYLKYAFTKSEKTSGLNLSWLSVNYGPSYGYRAPEKRSPSGTLNFTIADKPTLYLNITDTLSSSLSGQKRTVVRAVTIGWGLYIVSEDRGTLRFAN